MRAACQEAFRRPSAEGPGPELRSRRKDIQGRGSFQIVAFAVSPKSPQELIQLIFLDKTHPERRGVNLGGWLLLEPGPSAPLFPGGPGVCSTSLLASLMVSGEPQLRCEWSLMEFLRSRQAPPSLRVCLSGCCYHAGFACASPSQRDLLEQAGL